MSNPLLQGSGSAVDYHAITLENMQAAFDHVLHTYGQGVERVIEHQQTLPTWDDLVLAVDGLDAQLLGVFYAASPLIGKDAAWADAIVQFYLNMNAALNTRYGNGRLFALYDRLAASNVGRNLDAQQRATLRWHLEKFRISGASLSAPHKQRLQQLQEQITALEEAFLGNMARPGLLIDSVDQLRGIAERGLAELALQAQQNGSAGWLIPCEAWATDKVLEEAQDRTVRERVYRAYHERGVHTDPEKDNASVLQRLAALRHERAQLLGFSSHMALSLQRKSAGSEHQVRQFLQALAGGIAPAVLRWRAGLEAAAQAAGLEHAQPWDRDFLQAQARNAARVLSNDAVREFFPLSAVVRALLQLAQQLFGLELRAVRLPAWHPSVLTFEAWQDHALLGLFYLDAVQHPGKQPDAVYTTYVHNRRVDAEGIYQQAVVMMYSDIPAAAEGDAPLLDHRALRKVFHEFGHALHHLLVRTGNQVLSSVSELGTDGTELLGKLFERWVWNVDYLVGISAHHLDERRISHGQMQRCIERYQREAIGDTARDLSLALFDLDLHANPNDGTTVRQRLEHAREQCRYWPLAAFEHPAHAFDYLVTGYDAGYYAYLWADACAMDIFARFEQVGLLDRATGQALHQAVIAPGASRPLHEGLQVFLGRKPSVQPYLRWHGVE